MENKIGQIWIETVLYTLIGLALIGLVLAFAMPKINESRDKLLVDQAVESLNFLDIKINEVAREQGNLRNVDFTMKKGEIYFNPTATDIVFVISGLAKPYSEPGVTIQNGRIEMLSTKGPKTSSVNLTLKYAGRFAMTYDGKTDARKFTASTFPYKFSVENKGDTTKDGLEEINIKEVSK